MLSISELLRGNVRSVSLAASPPPVAAAAYIIAEEGRGVVVRRARLMGGGWGIGDADFSLRADDGRELLE